jgi:hypothetical protein
MVIRRLAIALVLVCGALVWTACHKCNFRLLWQTNVGGGTGSGADKVGCCGASKTFDVTIQAAEDGEVDLTNTLFPGQSGRVDAWLVDTSCDRLFDETYPGASPRCRTHLGPVAPDQVSGRIRIPAGEYRIVLQAYTSNTEESQYAAEVGLWGRDCKFKYKNPAAP